MSTTFAMVGDPDAGVCVDGVCVVPVTDGAPDDPSVTTAPPTDETSATR